MKRIIENKKIEIIINKSRFIGFVFYVTKEEEITKILNDLRKEYKDASHHCYAYIIGNSKRFNDDKEPVGGLPILNILENNNLNNVLCVVVRYFGGIKLGVGGLNRAYGKSCKETLVDNIKELECGYKVIVNFQYDDLNEVNFLLNTSIIGNKEFNDTITYELLVSKDKYQEIENKLTHLCKVESVEEIYF